MPNMHYGIVLLFFFQLKPKREINNERQKQLEKKSMMIRITYTYT